MTKAEQIAGYLKLTAAHYATPPYEGKPFMDLRSQIADEMDIDTYLLCSEIKRALGGYYNGDKDLMDVRKAERLFA